MADQTPPRRRRIIALALTLPSCRLLAPPSHRFLAAVALTLALISPALASPSAAPASQSASLHVALTPERLGGRTTIRFSFHITSPPGSVPSPLVAANLSYPAKIGFLSSGLGLQTCPPAQLEAQGRCPANSLMGYGDALVEFPIGPETIFEHGTITTWMAPVKDGHLTLLFYAEGQTPVAASLIFTSQILGARAPFGGQLATEIPVIPTFPEGGDAAVVQMTSTIGPMNVTYYRQFRGKRTAYHPRGVRLPEHCPHGGFPFAAAFSFLDGTHTTAHATVPCPRSHQNP